MIRELIRARALELAAHDGVPVAVVHLHGAASNLVGEIAREKDAAIADLVRLTAAASPIAAHQDVPQQAAEVSDGPAAVAPEAAGDASTQQVPA